MRQLRDPVWQVRGTSWVWDEEARNQICAASEVWSLRQFLRAKGSWPVDLPSNGGRTLVVAGLDGSVPPTPTTRQPNTAEHLVLYGMGKVADRLSRSVRWGPRAESRREVEPYP